MDHANGYNALKLLNERGDLYFSLHIFCVEIKNLEKLRKIIEGKKKDIAKSVLLDDENYYLETTT